MRFDGTRHVAVPDIGLPRSLQDDFSLANGTAVLWDQDSSTSCREDKNTVFLCDLPF